MRITGNRYFKVISWLLLISFVYVYVFRDYAYAKRYIGEKHKTENTDIQVPFEYGEIMERYKTGKDHSPVILIHDLHANYRAQEKIQKILEFLNRNYSIAKIGVEGTEGEIDTSIVRAIPDKQVKENVVKYFMRYGMVTGAEAFDIMQGHPCCIEGMEDGDLYKKDKELLVDSVNRREQTVGCLEKIKYYLNLVEDKEYGSNLRKFRNHYALYRQEKLEADVFQKYLRGWAKKAGISIPDISPEYVSFMRLTGKQKELKYKKIQKEYNRLLEEMGLDSRRKGIVDKFRNFFRTPESVRLKMSRRIYSGRDYRNLRKYIETMKLSRKINTERLVEEEREVIEKVSKGLCRDRGDRDLLFVSRYIQLMVKYLLNQITSKELDRFYGEANEFRNKFESIKERDGLNVQNMEEYLSELKPYIRQMGRFYSIARERDRAFFKNSKESIKNSEGSMVMVTGGFHTSGLKKLLKEKEIPYVVVSPRVSEHTGKDVKIYYELLKGEMELELDKVVSETMGLSTFMDRGFFGKRAEGFADKLE